MKITGLKECKKMLVIYLCMLSACVAADQSQPDFDILLDKTSYALLLKELISLSDAIGLLKHRMENDERRFVEDSILGKAVRVEHMLTDIDFSDLSEDDVNYLLYWISLAKEERLPQLVSARINYLEDLYMRYAYAHERT